jgi:membrane associated rhomboid family serine protease
VDTPSHTLLNPLPWAVWVLILPLIGVEAVLLAAQAGLIGGAEAAGWRVLAVQRYGFSGALMEHVLETRRFTAAHLWRVASYPFVHVAGLQTLFVVVLLTALGRAVGQVFHGVSVLAVAGAASVGGALIYGAVFPDPYWLVGGYPAVFGLVGAYTFMLWNDLAGSATPRARAFVLVGVLLGLRVVVGLTLGAGHEWAADVAGFCIGFALSFLVSPGGWRGALDRLRER